VSIVYSTATELAAAIWSRQVSAVEVLDAHLTQIAEHNPRLNAVVTLDEDGARRRAEAADRALQRRERWGPLHGVPVTLKDTHSVAGLRGTWGGLPEYAQRIATEDSAIAAKLRQAGAVIVGTTNVSLWNDNIFGRSNNPWDLERTASGSSAGSAVAVAAGLSPLDIGSDSLASLIGPAAFCGVFGMRPTEHRVSNAGCKAFGIPHTWLPFTVHGPLARSVEDLELAMEAISGPDGRDPDVSPLGWRRRPRVRWKELRIAWDHTFPNMTVARDVRQATENLADQLRRKGAFVERTKPELDYLAEHRLAWQFMPYSWDEIFRANGWIAADEPQPTLEEFRQAVHQREQLTLTWERFLSSWDAVLYPAAPTTATRHGETEPVIDGQKVPADENECVTDSISPLTGLPCIVVPVGLDSLGLPMAVQLIGRRWEDERLLAIAASIAHLVGEVPRPPGY
jgi:amidase